ncbi:MAG: hypothetical protein DRN12_06450 [Thermoplasmata archaeon]|nr:MAG: hypothetical protein DRN12_06450 [Thermoplasmata archaeon]
MDVVCPSCGDRNIIRYGRYNGRQVYLCKECGRKFNDNSFKGKMYSAKVITSAISFYNLGYTLDESARKVNRRFKTRVSRSTVHSWVKEFYGICDYNDLRSRIKKRFRVDEVIQVYSFMHGGLTYDFRYHQSKLEILGNSFPSIVRYLKGLNSRSIDEFFREDDRSSKTRLDIKVETIKSYNNICRLTWFALQACDNNRERHNRVEDFMLINDTSTIACEVPIYYWEKKLGKGICGHIDILQIRDDKVFILDYKPDAEKENKFKVVSQLYLYASGLSFRTGIPLKFFRCGWFDDKNYYEFKPINCKLNWYLK